jgi:hypothetical protein
MITNERLTVSRNKREGWYAGKFKVHDPKHPKRYGGTMMHHRSRALLALRNLRNK